MPVKQSKQTKIKEQEVKVPTKRQAKPAVKVVAKPAVKVQKKPVVKVEPKHVVKVQEKPLVKVKEQAVSTSKKDSDKVKTSMSIKRSTTPKANRKKIQKAIKDADNVVVLPKKKRILYVTSECQPFIATGGLADVAGSLPKFIDREDKEVDIRVVLPLYKSISETYKDKLQYLGNTYIHLSWRNQYLGVFSLCQDGVTYYFIDNEYYFKRDKAYGYFDDAERFAYFSKAVLEMESITHFLPDILHANDWQSALSVIYLKTIYSQDPRYKNTRSVFTIHNIEYQGKYGRELLGDIFDLPDWALSIVEYDNCINLVKGAIQSCDKFTTVSPTYAEEIKTPEFSKGLHYIINQNSYKLQGILNGIDYDFYNPKTEKLLVANYDFSNIQDKVKNKLYIQHEFGLQPLQGVPMVAIVSRLVKHKGMDLIRDIMETALQQNRIQLVVVGPGDPDYCDYFRYLESKHPGKVKAVVGNYSLEIGKKIYAASDIYLMPSMFEPCGLSQMIASRFGCIPIVRETGGLKDSIKDFGCEGGGNGYTFKDYNPYDLLYNINRAVHDYYNQEKWLSLVKTVMSVDFSWQKSAKQYIQIYNQLI